MHFIRTLLFTIVLLIQLGLACKSIYSFLPSSVYDLVGREGSVSSCWFLISGTFSAFEILMKRAVQNRIGLHYRMRKRIYEGMGTSEMALQDPHHQ